jgi:outer membrane protein assembly factor BamD (BamD/ComL family)
MNRLTLAVVLVLLGLFLFPYRSPAPLVYRPGEGWSYETPGAKGDWRRPRAKEQLDVSQQAFDKKQYGLALKSAERVIKVWPLSDYAPQAQYLIGRCYEAGKKDEKAFNAYQAMLEKYPKTANTDEVQRRQFTIAVRFLHGQWFKLFGYIPFFPSMEKTSEMFQKIVHYGPYGELGPPSQMNIGVAREKQKDYPLAVQAYATAADRYSDQPKVAADAQYKEAMAYDKQARKAGYDQSIAGQAIATFTDFMALYPDDPRVADSQRIIKTRCCWPAPVRLWPIRRGPASTGSKGARRAPPPPRPLRQRRQSRPRRPNNMRAWLLLILAIAAGGCAGYKLGPTNGNAVGSRTVQFKAFINKTHEPRVTGCLSTSLREQLQQDGTFRLQTSGRPDIVVSGEITRFDRVGLSYLAGDVLTPSEYTLTMQAHVVAVDMSTGKTFISRTVQGSTYLRIGNDEYSAERQAIPLLTDIVARDAISLLANGSW